MVLYDHVFFPICEQCACMWKFFSPPGPLVFPGPIFMNQREQALARIRPLQALRHKRDKHKGTMVFTNSMGAETPFLTHLPIWLSRPPPLSLSEGRTLVSSSGLMVTNNVACWPKGLAVEKWLKPLVQVQIQSLQQACYLLHLVILCYVYVDIAKNCILGTIKIWCAKLIHFLVY